MKDQNSARYCKFRMVLNNTHLPLLHCQGEGRSKETSQETCQRNVVRRIPGVRNKLLVKLILKRMLKAKDVESADWAGLYVLNG